MRLWGSLYGRLVLRFFFFLLPLLSPIWAYFVLRSLTNTLLVLLIALVLSLTFFLVTARTKSSSSNRNTVEVGVDKSELVALPEELPEELIQACASGECVLYVGAGLSAQAGFPTWTTFVKGLLDWAIENEFIEREFVQSFRAGLNSGQADSVADGIVSVVQINDKLSLLHSYL